MSQKTNPTSLRLQKNSQNFAFPLFADCFWSETYQACFESQNYIASLLKQTSFSKAFFLAKMFYRKFPISIFIQDTRVTRKEKLLFFKKSLSRNIEQKSHLLRKDKTKYKAFDIDSKKTKMFTLEHSSFVKMNDLQERMALECKDLGYLKQLVRNDYLKTRQGFFKKMSNIVSISTKKARQSNFEKDIRSLFYKKAYKTQLFWPKQLAPKLPKIFARPCFSFCENVISLSFRQRKNLSIYDALYGNQKSFLTNANLHENLIAQQTKHKQLYACSQLSTAERKRLSIEGKKSSLNFQDRQNRNKVLTSEEIRYQVQTIQKRKILFPIYNCAAIPTFFPTSVTIEPIRFIKDYQNVTSLVDQVIALLEKRISFRQIKSLLFKDLSYYPQIKGIRISCSGRLGGRSKKAQKAKVQSDSSGATTLAAFSSNILFASKSASTSYGKVGVKIWLSFTDKRCAQL